MLFICFGLLRVVLVFINGIVHHIDIFVSVFDDGIEKNTEISHFGRVLGSALTYSVFGRETFKATIKLQKKLEFFRGNKSFDYLSNSI